MKRFKSWQENLLAFLVFLAAAVFVVAAVGVEIYSLSSADAYISVRRWEYYIGFGTIAVVAVGTAVYVLVEAVLRKSKDLRKAKNIKQ